ncbi:MAG: 6,7-dimethyl-8-ribityllumazine synthase [Candidatus Nanosalina sp.]
MNIGLVVARYNTGITEKMRQSAEEKASELDVEVVDIAETPGSYDTPLAADRLARREDIDAVVVLGAIIEGDTDHDKVIGHTVAEKLSQVSLDRDKPVTMGITGPGMTASEARNRVDYAAQAVESAVKMYDEL